MLLLILVFVVTLIAALLLLRGTVFLLKYFAQWINHARPKVFPRPDVCPRCEQPVGRFERLNSVRAVIFGGWTCPKCGSEFDQLDNMLLARDWNANLRDLEQRALAESRVRPGDERTPVERLFED